LTDPQEIANEFNHCFTSIVEKLLSNEYGTSATINSTSQVQAKAINDLQVYVASKNPDKDVFDIPPISVDFIVDYVNAL
jgi:hypothetical protein